MLFQIKDDDPIHAHHSVIHLESEYFRKKYQPRVGQLCQINLAVLNAPVAKALLKYIYGRPLELTELQKPTFLCDLFAAAESYRIKAPLKDILLVNFSILLDTVWRKEGFVDLVRKLYSLSLSPQWEYQRELRISIARRVADDLVHGKQETRDGMWTSSIANLFTKYPDFEEDVDAAMKKLTTRWMLGY